jgi:hypothetical protein
LLETAIEKFRNEAKTLYGDGAIKINVVDAADVPVAPTNVKPIQQIGLAIFAAFALAITALFFIYDYTTTQKTQTKAATDDIVKAKVKTKAKAKSTPKKRK